MCDVQSQAYVGLGKEANCGCRIQLECDSGESEDHAPLGLVAPDNSHQNAGAGDDCMENVSNPPPDLLPHTCQYQRKDSPVEALMLSPEPLEGSDREMKGEMARQRKAGMVKRKHGENKAKKKVLIKWKKWN